VPGDSVDPIWFDRTYFLTPSTNAAQRKPYALLLEAMKETGTAALGRFVLRGQEHFCLIRSRGDALALETLFLAEDVRSQVEIEEAVDATDVKEPELDLARQVIESLVDDFEPELLESDYRRDLRAMLEAKLAGEEIARPQPQPETPVVDLMEALRRSVAEVREQKAPARSAKAPAKKKTAARPKPKATARKSA
jgi:DNA end-binding protein Ku